jgi:hypothetical protein
MKRSRYGDALGRLISSMGITQRAFAAKAGLAPATITNYLSRHRRPDEAMLLAITRSCPSRTAAVDMACEHCRDEFERCGLPVSAVTISPSATGMNDDVKLGTAIADLGQKARNYPGVARLLLDLDTVLVGIERDEPQRLNWTPEAAKARKIAEHGPSYEPSGRAKPRKR